MNYQVEFEGGAVCYLFRIPITSLATPVVQQSSVLIIYILFVVSGVFIVGVFVYIAALRWVFTCLLLFCFLMGYLFIYDFGVICMYEFYSYANAKHKIRLNSWHLSAAYSRLNFLILELTPTPGSTSRAGDNYQQANTNCESRGGS